MKSIDEDNVLKLNDDCNNILIFNISLITNKVECNYLIIFKIIIINYLIFN